jgi:hypothetical protein
MFRTVFWVILPCRMIVDRRRRRENLKSHIHLKTWKSILTPPSSWSKIFQSLSKQAVAGPLDPVGIGQSQGHKTQWISGSHRATRPSGYRAVTGPQDPVDIGQSQGQRPSGYRAVTGPKTQWISGSHRAKDPVDIGQSQGHKTQWISGSHRATRPTGYLAVTGPQDPLGIGQ